MIDVERYTIIVRRVCVEGEELWRASVRELPDVAEYAETSDEAVRMAHEAIGALQQAAEQEGRKFPAPLDEEEDYSGRVTFRMEKSLHRAVAFKAEEEGVSINSYITTSIALRLSTPNQAAQDNSLHDIQFSQWGVIRLGYTDTLLALTPYTYQQQAAVVQDAGHGLRSMMINITEADVSAAEFPTVPSAYRLNQITLSGGRTSHGESRARRRS